MIVFARAGIAPLFISGRDPGCRAARPREALGDVRAGRNCALGLGGLAITAPFLLITFGERDVPSGLTAVLIAPASLFVAMFAPLLDRSEAIERRQAGGSCVGLVGRGAASSASRRSSTLGSSSARR